MGQVEVLKILEEGAKGKGADNDTAKQVARKAANPLPEFNRDRVAPTPPPAPVKPA